MGQCSSCSTDVAENSRGKAGAEAACAFPLSAVFPAMREAGAAIMAHYTSAEATPVERKEDNSPVTPADKAAHDILCEALGRLFPKVPVLSEEGEMPEANERATWDTYFLVDPLDGTKGFIRKTDHFTVNVALMQREEEAGGLVQPVAGLIYVPVTGVLYFGGVAFGSFRQKDTEASATSIHVQKDCGPKGPAVLQSDVSHTPRLDAWLKGMEHTRLRVGSSLKFCLLAEGAAQLFPCLHPTWEWDTAAGHALLLGAGGALRTLEGNVFMYGKNPPLNASFLASADAHSG